MRVFDLSFDYETDWDTSKPKKLRWDADKDSPRLWLDHSLLWTKPLRSGVLFAPTPPTVRRDGYLIWTDPSGDQHWYGSDAITHSYTIWGHSKELTEAKDQLSEAQRTALLNPPYTIGSSSIWPVKTKARPTINQGPGLRPG